MNPQLIVRRSQRNSNTFGSRRPAGKFPPRRCVCLASFAFNSAPTAFETPNVKVQQQRQWALVDSVGSSSAAFAASLRQLASSFAIAPERIASLLRDRGSAAHNFFARRGLRMKASPGRIALALAAHIAGDSPDLRKLAGDLLDLIPAYQYWPALNPPVNQPINTTQRRWRQPG
jgi:hypothetical protein